MYQRRTAVAILAAVALFGLACASGGRPAGPTTPPPPEPAIGGVTLIYPPDLRTPLAQVPWCADHHGNSSVYPCKWDKRERAAPGWDPQVPPVAIWVLASPTGCTGLTRFVRITREDTGGLGYSCFFAPGS